MNPQNFTLFFYVAALSFALIYGGFQKRILFWLTMAFASAGFAVQTVRIGWLWGRLGYPPATNLHQLFEISAWAILALYLCIYPLNRSKILTFFLMPLVMLIFLLGFMVPDILEKPKSFYFTPWFSIHIFLLVFGMAFFFLSFLYAAIFIMQDHSLRHRHHPSELPIPSLEEAERWSSKLLLTGYPLFTVGLASAILYGILYGERKDWRPGLLEGASILAWLVLGVAIYGWFSAKVHPRRRSWLVVAGAAFSVLIIIGIMWH